jgi:thermitase
VLALVALAPAARAAGVGSLAVGHPALHSEHANVGGVVESLVPPTTRVAANELLVTVRPHAQSEIRQRIQSHGGLMFVGSLIDLPVDLVRTAPQDRRAAIVWLRAQHGVESVQGDAVERPDAASCACTIPNDPIFGYQWYLYNAPGRPIPRGAGTPIYGSDVDAPRAWSQTLGSGVKVAVIDSGIDPSNPDLAGKVIASQNFTSSATTDDESGHGTHVAGVIAADFNNGIGIAGVAPRAQLLNVKVLAVDASGQTTGTCDGVASGIVWATNNGANVLNMSLGSPSPCDAIKLAIDYAVTRGALVVAAAGNDASTAPSYPAGYGNVLSVAATDAADRLAGFSNRGASWVDVAAPGDEIVSTLPTHANGTGVLNYGFLSGTSMAAPVVSGVAALIWSRAGATGRAVEDRIIATADAIPGTGSEWRYGRVDACRAVAANGALCPSSPAGPGSPTPAPAPPPPSAAQPGGPTSPPRGAFPGTYKASVGRRGGPLRLTVRDDGSALVRAVAPVQLRCTKERPRRVQVAVLSATKYGRIDRAGKFSLRLRIASRSPRNQLLQLAGRFDVSRRLATGTLRLTARTRLSPRCDSGLIKWSARRTGS